MMREEHVLDRAGSNRQIKCFARAAWIHMQGGEPLGGVQAERLFEQLNRYEGATYDDGRKPKDWYVDIDAAMKAAFNEVFPGTSREECVALIQNRLRLLRGIEWATSDMQTEGSARIFFDRLQMAL